MPDVWSAFAATQAAWRFWHHRRVRLPQLAQRLLACARDAVQRDGQRYGLTVHDWSHLNYATHTSKHDCLQGKPGERGYQAYVALAVSDKTGAPTRRALPWPQSTRAWRRPMACIAAATTRCSGPFRS